MTHKLVGEKRKLFMRILLSTTLSIALSILICSLILYKNFETNALSQIYQRDMDRLLQTRHGVDSMTQVAITLSNQIYRDLNVAQLMYYSNPGPAAIRSADGQLTNYRLSIPFIDSVYIYNAKNQNIYINSIINKNVFRDTIQPTDQFDDPFAYNMIQQYSRYPRYQPIPRTLALGSRGSMVKRFYTFLIYDSLAGDHLNSAIVVNIAENWINDFINNNRQNPDSLILIINRQGKAVSHNLRYPMMSDLSDKSWLQPILEEDKSSGARLDRVNEEDCLITYTDWDKLGWRYIMLTPTQSVFQDIRQMRNLAVIIALSIFLLGAFISFFISRRLYSPIDEIMTNLTRLLAEKKKNIQPLQNLLFRDILLERRIYSEENAQAKFDELNISFDSSGYFRVILMKIDRYNQFGNDYTAEERGMIKRAIIEKSQEKLGPNRLFSSLEIGGEGIVLLLNVPETDLYLSSGEIGRQLIELRKSILENLHISLSFAVSSIERSVDHLPALYKEAVECSRYRLFHGYGSILFAEDLDLYLSNHYEYPLQMEKQLIKNLMAGRFEDAKIQFDKILTDASGDFSMDIFSMTLSRLSFAINDAVYFIRKNNALDGELEQNVSMKKLSQVEIYDEIRQIYFDLFDFLEKAVSDKKSKRVESLVDEINLVIDHRFADRDFYIESIADQLNRSSTYICHIYKQQTGATILDRIVEARMSKAREYLQDSDFSVAEIAERVGFSSSSYFFKVFKKVHGATPSSYRLQTQSRVKEESQ